MFHSYMKLFIVKPHIIYAAHTTLYIIYIHVDNVNVLKLLLMLIVLRGILPPWR